MKKYYLTPKKIISNTVLYVFLAIVVFIVIYPILMAFFGAFKTNMEILTNSSSLFPKKWQFENFKEAWKKENFALYTFNSVYLTSFVVVGVLAICTSSGYSFARGKFFGKEAIFGVFMLNMLFAMGSMVMLPQYMIAKALGLHRGLTGVIIIRVFGVNVSSLVLMRSFISAIPRELDDAAKIDGCNFFGIYLKVILPLLKPIIATVGLMTFRNSWNDYLLPMVFTINDRSKSTLIVAIVRMKSSGEGATNWNLMLAGTCFALAPMLVIYLSFQKFYVAGLVSGALKG